MREGVLMLKGMEAEYDGLVRAPSIDTKKDYQGIEGDGVQIGHPHQHTHKLTMPFISSTIQRLRFIYHTQLPIHPPHLPQ